jgi:hypothetical protein
VRKPHWALILGSISQDAGHFFSQAIGFGLNAGSALAVSASAEAEPADRAELAALIELANPAVAAPWGATAWAPGAIAAAPATRPAVTAATTYFFIPVRPVDPDLPA